MTRAFWVIMFLVVAVSAHLTYILYAPTYQLKSRIDAAAERFGVNTMSVLAGEDERAMLGGDGTTTVSAVCALDLGGGAVKLVARLPREFWTLAIYGQDGRLMAAYDEKQTGLRAFELTLLPPRSIEALIGGEAPAVTANDPWSERMTGSPGLLVLTANLPAPYMRARLARELAESRCAPVPPE